MTFILGQCVVFVMCCCCSSQRGKPVGLENISAPVLFVPRCPGEPFSGVLVWSSYSDSLSCERLLAPKLSSGWETRSRYCTSSSHPVLYPEINRKSRVWHGEGTRQGLHAQDWRAPNSSLVFCSSPEPSLCSPSQAVAGPCGFGTAHQDPHLRSQKGILWCAVK